MAILDEYYRAYREYMQAVSPLSSYNEYIDALQAADKGADTHGGNIRYREVDTDWLEAIEAALPSIDLAIRENRRFITQQDEIVPIEKSRKITSESVRHLAQHTNLIAKVEGDEVTPESILNIFREESFAIYENRFLRTLLDNAINFVEKRYSALSGASDVYAADLKMERELKAEQENIHFNLEYNVNFHERESFDIHDDVSTMSGFERIIRVRKILSDFSALPLMRELQKAERVRPPIVRTNVLLKDPNFRNALELWTFIESYRKDGYRTVTDSASGAMNPEFQHGLYDAMDFLRFSMRMHINPALKERLQENYNAENLRREAEAKRLEKEKLKEEEKRLQAAVDAERQAQEVKQQALIEEHKSELENQAAEYENKLTEQKIGFDNAFLQQKNEFETALFEQKCGFEAKFEQQKCDFETEIAQQKCGFEAEIERNQTEFNEKMSLLQDDFNSKTAELTSKITETTENYEKLLISARENHENELAELNRDKENELAKLKQEKEDEKSKLFNRLAEQKEATDKAKSELASLKLKLRTAEQTLAKEKRTAEIFRQTSEKNTEKLQRRLEIEKRKHKEKLEKQEKRSRQRIEALERKLEKALAKHPEEEVQEEE